MKVRDVETTPMIPGLILFSVLDLPEHKIGNPLYLNTCKLFHMSLVVCLLYVMTCTRPDISCAIAVTSCIMTMPLHVNWLACLYVFKYLYVRTDMLYWFTDTTSRITL